MGLENMETIVIETVQHIGRRNEYHNRAVHVTEILKWLIHHTQELPSMPPHCPQ